MKHFAIYLGIRCNNNCIMCNVKDNENNNYENSYDEIYAKMKKNVKSKNSVGFTGGEPTVHPDIVEIFKKANILGYDFFTMTTNGIRFSNKKFTKKLIKYNLKSVDLTLHGTEEVHDKIVRNKGAFKKAVQGIENLQEYNLDIVIVSVLMKQNIDNLRNLYKKILEMGVKKISILDLNYEGRAQNNFEDLNPSFVKKKKFFYDNFDLLNNFEEVILFNFPRCVLPKKFPKNTEYISEFKKRNNFEFEGGLGGDKDLFEKCKVSICKKCKFSEECFGFLKKSIEIYGEENVEEMLKIDNFLD